MIIYDNPDDYEVKSWVKTCPWHQEHPGKNFAGCTCSAGYLRVRKEKEQPS